MLHKMMYTIFEGELLDCYERVTFFQKKISKVFKT